MIDREHSRRLANETLEQYAAESRLDVDQGKTTPELAALLLLHRGKGFCHGLSLAFKDGFDDKCYLDVERLAAGIDPQWRMNQVVRAGSGKACGLSGV